MHIRAMTCSGLYCSSFSNKFWRCSSLSFLAFPIAQRLLKAFNPPRWYSIAHCTGPTILHLTSFWMVSTHSPIPYKRTACNRLSSHTSQVCASAYRNANISSSVSWNFRFAIAPFYIISCLFGFPLEKPSSRFSNSPTKKAWGKCSVLKKPFPIESLGGNGTLLPSLTNSKMATTWSSASYLVWNARCCNNIGRYFSRLITSESVEYHCNFLAKIMLESYFFCIRHFYDHHRPLLCQQRWPNSGNNLKFESQKHYCTTHKEPFRNFSPLFKAQFHVGFRNPS